MLKALRAASALAASLAASLALLPQAFAGPLDTLTPGKWYAFPNSHMESVNPNASGSVYSVMMAWSGGAYDSDRDQLIIWGGGHTDYAGNEVYAFGPVTGSNPQWRLLTQPSDPPADNTPYGSDGRPVSRHTYNLLTYLPAPRNKMMSCAIGSQHSNGYSNAAVDLFDLTVNGMTTNPWSRAAAAPSTSYALEAFCIYDPVDQVVWFHDAGSNNARLQRYNPSTNSWTAHAQFNFSPDYTPAIDPAHHLLVATGNGGGVRVWDLSAPDNQSFMVTTSGPGNVESGKAPGFVYDPVNHQFVGWSGGSGVYALTIPANPKTGTWSWSQIPLAGDNSVVPTTVAGLSRLGYVTGTYGRFRYVPGVHGVIAVNATDESVYFFKLPDNGGAPLPAISLSANPTDVPAQGTSLLTWTSTNAASCSASGSWSGTKATAGTESVGPLTQSSTYNLTCDNGGGGTSSRSATVTVAQSTPAPTVTFTASPSTVASGGTSTLAWTTANASSCTASGGWSGSKATQGSQSVGPLTQQTSYTLACTGSGGTTSRNTTVSIAGTPPLPIVNFSAAPLTVVSGQNSTLTWSTANATSCTASGGWSGSKATSGTQSVGPLTQNTTYGLSCTGSGGSAQSSATVSVTAAATPTLSLDASPTTVNMNGTTQLSWTSTNATSCSASGGWTGNKPTSGNETTAALAATTSFALDCTGAGGTVQKSMTVTVAPVSNDPAEDSGGGALEWFSLLILLAIRAGRTLRRVGIGLLGLAGLLSFAQVATAADITTVTLMSRSGSAQTSVPVTFGEAFKAGDVPSGTSIVARLSSGASLPLQVNAKATHDDGSLRHAILTATLPSLAANGSQVITLASGAGASLTPAVQLSDLLATSYDTTVTLTVGPTTYTASARQALQTNMQWLSGPQVSEWIAGGPIKTAAGLAHPHLAVYFHVRAYAGNPIASVRTDVVIENNWSFIPGPADQTYSATIAVPGKASYTKSGLSHYALSRWHKRMWWGNEPQVYAWLDKDYLQDSKAIPKYEDVQPTDGFLNSVRSSVEPMDNGDQTDNMDDTGFQEGIGPLPKWDAIYAVSADPRAFAYMLANADGGSVYGMHYRDELTGYPVTIDDHPTSSIIDPVGSILPLPTVTTSNPFSHGGSPAHQPSIGYLAYLVTGDYFYLEEMQFWSAYNLIWPSVTSRSGANGYFYVASLRGQAWSYRSLAQAAYITPDSHRLKAYFLAKLQNNIRNDVAKYVNPGGPYKNNLGAMYMAEGNEQYRFYDYFMSWAVGYLVDLGYTEAIPLRDYKVKFPIGLMGMSSNEYCFQASAHYTWKVGPGGPSTFYPDFKTVYQNTDPGAAGRVCGSQDMASYLGVSVNEIISGQQSTGYYFSNLQAALASAYDSGLPGAHEAWQRTLLSGKHPDYRDEPIWAIVPRTLNSPSIVITLSANPTSVQTGGSATLSWSSTNASGCSASDGWAGTKSTSGSESVGPLQSTSSFTLTCSSSSLGSSSRTVVVSVAAPAAPTLNLSAAPSTVQANGSSTLTWTSSNATSCTASGGWSGSKATSGSQSVGPLTTTTNFTLSCSGAGGNVQKTAMVTVGSTPPPPPPPPAPTVTLSANPTAVDASGTTALTWSSTNATSCVASDGWSGTKLTSGTETSASLTVNTTFTLRCDGNGDSASQSVTVTVNAAGGGDPGSSDSGGGSFDFASLLALVALLVRRLSVRLTRRAPLGT